MNNSGMSLIITMLLLIGTAIVIGTAYYLWSNNVFNDATEKITPTITSSIGEVIKPIEISTIDTYYFTNLDLNGDNQITNNPEERFIETIRLEFINNIKDDLIVNTRIYCLTPNVSWASVNIDENNNSLLLDRDGNPYNYSGYYVYFNGTTYYSSMKFYDENGKLYYAAASNGNALNTSNLLDLIDLNCPTKSFLLKGDSKKSISYYILINNTKVPNTIIFKIVASTKYGDVEKKITFEIS
ncbi:conserved hypothetical protein [Methanocaldococcus sp. FS406-22]|uniref:hypothetical protein n=1 Tax=Methanocaldococcus sp. (strain FS406-22) TaxID=644281 RepID=UPI0001BF176E|nr:hypothetical protein [Methanocaldococcus sp. FS406-22]ADC69047.1 conserved hypothetical protein [Methanocaldococcus sp. FS406-22]